MNSRNTRLWAILAIVASGAATASAVTVNNSMGWGIPHNTSATISTPDPFDIAGGSSLVVAIAAETRALPTPSMVDNVFFGGQPLSFIGRTTDTASAGTQLVELWYLDEAFNHEAIITVNWATDLSATPVNGSGIGALSINEVAGPAVLYQGADGTSIDIDVPSNNSLVVAGFVANTPGSPAADVPLTQIYSSNNVGSAVGSAGYENGVAAGLATYSFSGAGGSRPVTFAAAFETGVSRMFEPPIPGDTNGDRVVDAQDFINIRNSLGYVGLPIGQGPDVAGSDGVVDFQDLRFFQSQFPFAAAAALAGVEAAPEPAGACLGLLAAGLAASLGRRQNR